MSFRRPVLVMEMPEQLNSVEMRAFMQEFAPLLEADGPRIVFDCSQVRYLDGFGVEMMLHCLQEAMKRDGDLKLAALSPESQLVLELMREARVLQAFASSDEAVRSFQPASAERNAKRASSSVNVFPDSGAFNKAS